jgi:hypothetical protein
MTISVFIALLPALLGLAVADPLAQSTEVRTMVIEDQLIMRVPVRPQTPRRIEWVERDGPRCITSKAIRGASLSTPGHVDFLLPRRQRVRAVLSEDCPALDFYSGFYLAPEDERICAGRDSIRSRMGGNCRIDAFRHLVPRQRQIP